MDDKGRVAWVSTDDAYDFADALPAARRSFIFGKQMPVENHTSSTPARCFANCASRPFHTSSLSVWGLRRRIAENGIPPRYSQSAIAAPTDPARHAINTP